MTAKNKTSETSTPHYCTLIELPPNPIPANVMGERLRMIRLLRTKWANGTKLKYYFFNGPSDGTPAGWKGSNTLKAVVRQAFDIWKATGMGIVFEESTDKNEAEVRIGFLQGDGSWSYVGRDVIDAASSPNERTMNFGWNIANEVDTAVHEIGHTLGAPHEHQNPFAGIVWDDEAVYAALAAPPNNWPRETTYHNIIRKLASSEVEGSTHDPNSVMHYPFGPGLILQPEAFRNGIDPAGGLSAKDKEFIKIFYPPLVASDYVELSLAKSEVLNIQAGQQKNYVFKPKISKKYKIETFGQMDTVMVLFERSNGEDIYLSGDDDSGTDYNSKINMRLIKGREYVIRLRLYYAGDAGSGSIMVY